MIKPQPSTGHQAVLLSHYNAVNSSRAQLSRVVQGKNLVSISPASAFLFGKKRASYHACRSVNPSASSSNNIDEKEGTRFQVEIPTSEAQTALRFSAVRVGGGKAIVIDAVASGSEAEFAKIRPGQQLFSLSDPIRPQETWTLNDRASLRYIRDAVKLRRAPYILLELSLAPLPEWLDEKQGSSGGGVAPLSSSSLDPYISESDNEAPAPAPAEQDLLSAVAAEAAANLASSSSSFSSLDSVDLPGSSTSASQTDSGTIGERLQRNYKKSNAGMTDLERRVSKRKEYFAQTSTRNDGPFFAAVLAAFLLPALIILGIASSSGYLDALADGWAGR